jgi:hypothetical protein
MDFTSVDKHRALTARDGKAPAMVTPVHREASRTRRQTLMAAKGLDPKALGRGFRLPVGSAAFRPDRSAVFLAERTIDLRHVFAPHATEARPCVHAQLEEILHGK